MLFTRKGDGGTSGLFDTSERFSKDAPIFEALGTVDELNALLGFCFLRGDTIPSPIDRSFAEIIRSVQEDLFIVQAELAGTEKTLLKRHVETLEATIAAIEEAIENPHAFVIAGTTELSTLFDYTRTVSRRAERRVVAAKPMRTLSAETYQYLNRLSSLLYALARCAAQRANEEETKPSY